MLMMSLFIFTKNCRTGLTVDAGSMQPRASTIDEEEMLKMRADYDQKMQDLINKFKQEQESNAKLKVIFFIFFKKKTKIATVF